MIGLHGNHLLQMLRCRLSRKCVVCLLDVNVVCVYCTEDMYSFAYSDDLTVTTPKRFVSVNIGQKVCAGWPCCIVVF